MEDSMVLLFEITGSAQVEVEKELDDVVEEVNDNSDSLCELVEAELRKLLPPGISVRSALQFEVGDPIMRGTVALVSWNGSLLLRPMPVATGEYLAMLVRIGLERATNRFVQGSPPGLSDTYGLSPVGVRVEPKLLVGSALGLESLSTERRERATSAHNKLLAGAVLVILLIQLSLVAERLFLGL